VKRISSRPIYLFLWSGLPPNAFVASFDKREARRIRGWRAAVRERNLVTGSARASASGIPTHRHSCQILWPRGTRAPRPRRNAVLPRHPPPPPAEPGTVPPEESAALRRVASGARGRPRVVIRSTSRIVCHLARSTISNPSDLTTTRSRSQVRRPARRRRRID